jgi:RecA-family ATPase
VATENESIMNQITARFKIESCFVIEIYEVNIAGGYTKRSVIKPKKETDFPIHSYNEGKFHYDIVVLDTLPQYIDGGEKHTIINVPKDMITIANKPTKPDDAAKG